MIHGRNLIVSIGDTPVAAAKSCTINVSQDFIQACSPTYGRVKTKIPVAYDWSVSVSGLIGALGNVTNLIDLLIGGTKVLLTFKLRNGLTYQMIGYAYVKSCEESGSVGSLTTYSASFESTGPLYTIYSTYNATGFAEGHRVLFDIVNNKPYYGEDEDYNTCGTEITIEKAGLLSLYSDNPYVVYAETFAQVKAAMATGHMDDIESSLVIVNAGASTVKELLQGTYTVLESTQAQSGPEISITLYQEA